MQLNATLKTKMGNLHLELINDATNFKNKLEFLVDDDYLNESKLGELINNATHLAKSLSYFKSIINDFKFKKIETAEWHEAS